MSTVAADSPRFTVKAPVVFNLATGYTRTLKSGTELRAAGTIPQGRVLKPIDTVFTIEGRHVHEAYLVVSQGQVTGFYLPVEKAFSLLSPAVPISLEERGLF